MQRELKRILQIFFLLALIGSTLVITVGIFNEIKLAKIRSEGKIVIGEVIDSGKLEKKSGIKTHFLKVKFFKKEGTSTIQFFPVDEDDYTHALKLGTIPITYVTGNPELTRVGKYYGHNRSPLYFAIIIFAFSIAGMIILEYKYRKFKKVKI